MTHRLERLPGGAMAASSTPALFEVPGAVAVAPPEGFHTPSVARFTVLGIPRPQGSKKAFIGANGRAMMKESGALTHAQWRNAVSDKAQKHASLHGPFKTAVGVAIEFRFPMIASRTKAQKSMPWIYKTVAPDLDKLARSMLDAFEAGGLLVNDSLVCDLHVTKIEVSGWTGAEITITQLAS